MRERRSLALDVFAAALQRVGGRAAVRRALAGRDPGPCAVLAIGKAADAMLQGAAEVLGERMQRALLVTKHGHADARRWRDTPVTVLEASHPVPDASCLAAGRAVLEFLAGLPPGLPLLALVSGGASALVEVPRAGVTLADLQRVNAWLLGSGLPIGEMNKVRKALSAIKGGGLLAHLRGRAVLGLLISDVPGDDPGAIGSGLLVPAAPGPLPALPNWLQERIAAAGQVAAAPGEGPELLLAATLGDALAAAAAAATAAGLAVHRHDAFLEGEAGDCGRELARYLCGADPGVHLWGGETTVRLPAEPGRGGRNQHLALAAAQVLAGRGDLALLAAGTDGTDGPTADAGGLVDGGTWQRAVDAGLDPADALRRADAGTVLAATGDLVNTGPTGTNVMDLVVAVKDGDGTP